MSRLEKRESLELVELIAGCWRDHERLVLEAGACVDTASDAMEELLRRGHPFPMGDALAATFVHWLADAEALQAHEQDLELRREAERFMREWKQQQ